VFDHVTLRASNGPASIRFYDVVLETLGIPMHEGDGYTAWGAYEFFVIEDPASTRGLHIAFSAPTREHVHEFWATGTAAEHSSDGEPGPRPQYGEDYYGSFLLDPDGNSAEAVHYDSVRRDGCIDHMWLRVADVAASTLFYETIAPHAGFAVRRVSEDRTQLIGESGSFSVVTGEPTANVHIAFPASENATVDEFHRAATQAGYRDNGPPGERTQYHEGYYGAFVLDPDGNNVEVVNHGRG
jgi:predicted lactoylglutathione lyase